MPPRKTFRKSKRTRKPKRTTVLVNRALHPIPQRFITKQKYSDTFAISALVPSYVFNLNSTFDPNRTGAGHQPYGRDTLADLYNRYRVISCSFVINGYADNNAIRIACIATNELPSLTSVSDLCERPRARFIVQNPGGNTQYLKGSISIASLVGRTKAQYMADDRYQADVAANPAELALLQIAAGGMNDSTAAATLTITLEYTVEYFDMRPLGQS